MPRKFCNCTADTLYRTPLVSEENDAWLQGEEAHLPAITVRLHQCRIAQAKDPIGLSIIDHCWEGWLRKSLEAHPAPYWKVCGELMVDKNGLLLYNMCIVVPKFDRRF